MDFKTFCRTYALKLNKQQEEAVCTTEGPVLLLAVPGSGKTTALVARLGYMILCCGIEPEQILTMTYTVAATGDMRRRFAKVFGSELAERLEFRTINGVSAQIIRRYEMLTGRAAFRLAADEGQLSRLVGEIYRTIHAEYPTESIIKSLRTAITYVKNIQMEPEELQKLQRDGIEIAPIYNAYCKTMRSKKEMDYDDQMVYAEKILTQYPQLLKEIQTQYRYFCVDEAQDTSRIQHAIIELLAGQSRNLFMVGDEDQSIYGFRAAYPEAMLHFEKRYPEGKVLFLEQNFRSTDQIVTAAERFIRETPGRREKKMVGTGKTGEKPSQIRVPDRIAQYTLLAQLAQTCTEETAVLYRNNDSALPVIDLMNRSGTPFRCRQFDSSFFTHRIVRDISDMISYAYCPGDRELFARIYYKWNARISKPAAMEVMGKGSPDYLLALSWSPALPPRTRQRCRELHAELEALKSDRGDEAVYRIAYHMGYITYLENTGCDTGKISILRSIGASEPSALRLLERLEELRRIVVQGMRQNESPFLLSTIHSSKGLEYKNVILMDVIDGVFPPALPPADKPTREEIAAYAEERRIFYVGITRAREGLAILSLPREEGYSTFTEEVFSEPKPKNAVKSQEQKIRVGRNMEYQPQCSVYHTKFGNGIIDKREGDYTTISFDSGETRLFSLKALLSLKLLYLRDKV